MFTSLTKQIITSNLKTSTAYTIQSTSQLKSILLKEAITSKTILMFIISALKNFPHSLHLFYNTLIQLIDKIQQTTFPIKNEEQQISFLIDSFLSFNDYLSKINDTFDNWYNETNIKYYFHSNSNLKHNWICFIFTILVTFSYYNFDVWNSKNSKKEIYHFIIQIRKKYICKDIDRIYCGCCSLNCMTLILNYVKIFINVSIGFNDRDSAFSMGMNNKIQYHNSSFNATALNDHKLEQSFNTEKGEKCNTSGEKEYVVHEEIDSNIEVISQKFEEIENGIKYWEDIISTNKKKNEWIKSQVENIQLKN